MKRKINFMLAFIFVICLTFSIKLIPKIDAYFADGDTAINEVSVGQNKIEITEDFDPPIKGEKTVKKPIATNVGNVDCFVRAKILVSDSRVLDYFQYYYNDTVGFNTQNWKLSEDGWLYYDQALSPGESSLPIFTHIELSQIFPDAFLDFSIDVIYESVQAYGFETAKESFESIDYDIESGPVKITNISAWKMPKTKYAYGERLDIYGLVLAVTYSNGKTELIEDGIEIVNKEFKYVKGNGKVTVAKGDMTFSYEVNCDLALTPSIHEIEDIMKFVRNSIYPNSDKYDSSSLDALYSAMEYADYVIGLDSDRRIYEVRNAVNGLQSAIDNLSEITEVTIKNVEVYSSPNKLRYYQGEKIDTSGLTLKVTYSDGNVEYVTSGFVVNNVNPYTKYAYVNYSDIYITYESFTVSYSVSIDYNTNYQYREELNDLIDYVYTKIYPNSNQYNSELMNSINSAMENAERVSGTVDAYRQEINMAINDLINALNALGIV